MNPTHLFSTTEAIGDFSIRELDPDKDGRLVHSWVSQSYADYWAMREMTANEVVGFYRNFSMKAGNQAYLGFFKGCPSFIVEIYNPKNDPVGEHYSVLEGDIGMHFLAAPPDVPVPGFTRYAFKCMLDFIFSDQQVKRIVVEPDANNTKIHKINKLFGFFHERKIKINEKNAYLGFCSRQQFFSSKGKNFGDRISNIKSTAYDSLQLSSANLQSEVWEKVNRLHLRKCLSELSHERIITPKIIDKADIQSRYEIANTRGNVRYQFTAELLPLDHWSIDSESIVKTVNGRESPLDSLHFILEFSDVLRINPDQLPTYLEEISATLSSAAFKHSSAWINADQLADADFQTIESAMIEGHPAFLANNGRIGFDAVDFHNYTPEAATPIQVVWLAAHRSRTVFSHSTEEDYATLIAREMDFSLRNEFKKILMEKKVNPDDYLFMPVHPWQWFNKLNHCYAGDIASQYLICLGYGDDEYQAQQSIRTLFNRSHPHKCYVKMALSILNMGFVRGLSADYMEATPAINDWVYKTLDEDRTIKNTGFTILREIAAVGYRNPHYNNELLGNNPYKKMLAALWRESPIPLISEKQNLMTMASLLHVDPDGHALLAALIHASPLGPDEWLQSYLKSYLTPLLHCYFQHQIVFMPHGENIILVMEDKVPVRCMLKDIGEEVCVLNSDIELPEQVRRISVSVPVHHEELSFFTDIFDCFFRYLTAILFEQMAYKPQSFWRLVAECIMDYQTSHPELSDKFSMHDLFATSFGLSCLNRLQLHNNQQLIDLTDPSKMLQFSGELKNPIAGMNKRYQSK